MNHEISYAVRGSRLGLLILFVCLLLIGSTAPTFAAQYSFSVPLPHKEKYMSNPAGDEDPMTEVDNVVPRPLILDNFKSMSLSFRFRITQSFVRSRSANSTQIRVNNDQPPHAGNRQNDSSILPE